VLRIFGDADITLFTRGADKHFTTRFEKLLAYKGVSDRLIAESAISPLEWRYGVIKGKLGNQPKGANPTQPRQ
jgi:ferric iron reductase protein FhuF